MMATIYSIDNCECVGHDALSLCIVDPDHMARASRMLQEPAFGFLVFMLI